MHDHSAAVEEPRAPGLPVSNAKLAMWLFLATEIMFFSGLIGAYIVLRFGTGYWPRPHDVHLVEWMGAVNTFVLICSSVSIVLAHKALSNNDAKKAAGLILFTLALAGVFLVIKAFEYSAKYQHRIIPGWVAETPESALRNASDERYRKLEALGSAEGKEQLEKERDRIKTLDEELSELRSGFSPSMANKDNFQKRLEWYHDIAAKNEDLHLPEVIPSGNLWASLYFTLTGIHALHVIGGMVIFVIMLLMASAGKFGVGQTQFVEMSGLYWHFVDIVWIFLFPLLYLIG